MLIYHPDYLKHILNPGHPENPERLKSIIKKLTSEALWTDILTPEPAKIEDVERVHAKEYISVLEGQGFVDMEAPVHADTFKIALLAAGGAILAAKHAFEFGEPAFALVRPPGHHAGMDYGGGFCYLNNIGIAAKAINKKTAIIDIDLHHGNGTSDIFYEDDRILYISTHQTGIYPGTGYLNEVGKGKGEGFNVNIPLPAGCGDKSFETAFDRLVIPILKQFAPEMLLVSFGADAHYMDPLGGLKLSTGGYLSIAKRLLSTADEICNMRIAFILEGGYHLDALSESVACIVGAFKNKNIKYKINDINDTKCIGAKAVENVVEIQKKYWSLM